MAFLLRWKHFPYKINRNAELREIILLYRKDAWLLSFFMISKVVQIYMYYALNFLVVNNIFVKPLRLFVHSR